MSESNAHLRDLLEVAIRVLNELLQALNKDISNAGSSERVITATLMDPTEETNDSPLDENKILLVLQVPACTGNCTGGNGSGTPLEERLQQIVSGLSTPARYSAYQSPGMMTPSSLDQKLDIFLMRFDDFKNEITTKLDELNERVNSLG